MQSNVFKVVRALLENEKIPAPTGSGRIVRIRTPEGEIKGNWNGYYDLRHVGAGTHHSIGYIDANGQWTHGMLKSGYELLDPVPSFEEWTKENERKDAERRARKDQIY